MGLCFIAMDADKDLVDGRWQPPWGCSSSDFPVIFSVESKHEMTYFGESQSKKNPAMPLDSPGFPRLLNGKMTHNIPLCHKQM